MQDAPDSSPPALLVAVRRIASDGATRPFLHWLAGLCDLMGPSGSERREGMRLVGRRVLELLDEADPRINIELARESAAAEIQRRTLEEQAAAKRQAVGPLG